MHEYAYRMHFMLQIDTARQSTAYSRKDSECHTNTTVHISLTAWPSYDSYACMPCTP